MTCGRCGASIADKAIVCYRCGAPTAIPAGPREAASAPGRGRLAPLLSMLLAVVLAGVAVALGEDAPARLPVAAGAVLAILVAGWAWFARRGARP